MEVFALAPASVLLVVEYFKLDSCLIFACHFTTSGTLAGAGALKTGNIN